MREIKFRAWDGANMHHDVSIVSGWGAIKHGYSGTCWTASAKAGEPMQYTGLKDKNDKEIYEGDVIRHDRGGHFQRDCFVWVAPVGRNIDGSYEMQCKQVECDEGLTDIDWRLYPYTDWMEIIGNIYENPELVA